jgi:hypothetical protein
MAAKEVENDLRELSAKRCKQNLWACVVKEVKFSEVANLVTMNFT